MKKKVNLLTERCMELRTLMSGIQDKANQEKRTLTAEENLQMEQYRNEHQLKMMEIGELREQAQLRSVNENERISLQAMLRSAAQTEGHVLHLPACTEKRAITVSGVGANVVETEIQGILEPLYANSVLAKLGVRFYPGLPQGNISIPVMAKGSVAWAAETGAASASNNTFTNVVLTPKRLTAYVDISKQLLAQDTIGVEEAIRRDIVNALVDKLEATIFGSAAGSTTQPKGMFWDDTLATPAVRTLQDATDFAKVCAIEAGVENNNVFGDMKYLLSTGAKADLRAMAKSTKNTQLVYEGGEVDGVPAITTSNVATAGAYIYGDFSQLAVASWGDIDITVDEFTQAVNGCVRLVINAFFDAKVLREIAFAYGKTRA